MLRKGPLQEGWLEIYCKNISPARFIMRNNTGNQKRLKYSHYAHKGGAI